MPPEPAPPFPRRRDWTLLAAGLCMLFVFCLGSRGLNEPDEGRYALMGQAMASPGGDWWEPRLSGYAHYDKPPLLYWVTALAFRAFGCNEWAARLPPLCGAVLALLGLAWTACRLRGERVAWWAVLICGTCVQFWVIARVLSPDMLLTGWCALAVGAWAECRHRAGRWRWWLLSLAFWTLAWWTKATPALIPLAGLTAGVWLTGDRDGRRALRPALLLPAMILLGSPWYFSMLHRYPELRRFFFGRELTGRMRGRVDGRHGSIFYYLTVSALAWLPWWPLAAWVIYRERVRLFAGRGASLARAWGERLGVEGWIVLVGLPIFSLAGSKLPTYSLVLAPWAALGMARLVRRLPCGAVEYRLARLLVPTVVCAGVVLVGIFSLLRRYEAALGVNASVRPVCELLRAYGARDVEADHYWAGLEFYLGEQTVRYVVHIDAPGDNDPLPRGTEGPPVKKHQGRDEHHHERATDRGQPPLRFIDPVVWLARPPAAECWLIRFRRNKNSPFDARVKGGPHRDVTHVARIGDFDVYRLSPLPP